MSVKYTYIVLKMIFLGVIYMAKNKHLGIRVENELHYKLSYIAEYEGRSINGQVIYLINQCIRNFEKENGKIEEEN